jgi:AcrR family transcriptional regulator
MPELGPRETVERSRVLVEALPSFRELGAGPGTLDDVARRLGVGREAIDYWFTSEVELLGALMKARQKVFLDELNTRFADLKGAGPRLRAVIELAVADYDATLWIELWRLSLDNDSARQTLVEVVTAYRALIGRLISAGRETGEFDPRSIDRATLTVIALIDGLSLHATLADPAVTPRLMYERCIALAERMVGGSLADAR